MSLATLASSFVFSAAVVLASLGGVDLVTLFVAIAAALAAFELSSASTKAGTKVLGVAVAVCAASFPIVARFRGEDGFIEAGAVAIITFGGIYIFRGLSARVSAALGSTVLIASLVGALTSYLVLVAARDDGARLLLILGTFVLVCRGAFFFVRKARSWLGHVVGGVATALSGLVLGLLIGEGLSAPKMMILAAIVAGAVSLSLIVGQMVKAQLSPDAPLGLVFPAIEPVLLAAPAFYYGVKLYLS